MTTTPRLTLAFAGDIGGSITTTLAGRGGVSRYVGGGGVEQRCEASQLGPFNGLVGYVMLGIGGILRQILRGTMRRIIRSTVNRRTLKAIAPTPTTATTAATLVALTIGFVTARFRWCGRRGGQRRGNGAIRGIHFKLPALQLRHPQQSLVGRILNKARELRHAEVLLIEGRIDFLHDLLQTIGAHHVAVALHAVHRFGDQLPRIPPGALVVARFGETGQRVVRVILVAIHHQQVAGRFADADADHILAVLLELDHHAREVGVA